MELIHSAYQNMANLCSWSSLRAAGALVAAWVCAAAATLSSLAHPSIPFLVALVCLDFALAAGIALYEDRFSWSGFRHGCGKFVAYALMFFVTALADQGMGISGYAINMTVGLSLWGISGESLSCLRHIDEIFPGYLPAWMIKRLETVRRSIEQDIAGHNRRDADRHGRTVARQDADLADCRGRIPEDDNGR